MFCLPVRASAAVATLVSSAVIGLSSQSAQPAVETGAAHVVRVGTDGTVSVKADGVAVRTLLNALHPACALDVRVDDAAGARPVSIEVANVTPMAAIGEIVAASGLDFAMQARCGTAERPTVLVLREAGRGPVDSRPSQPDPDDWRVKSEVLPPLPAGPPPEPEEREELDATSAVGVIGAGAGATQAEPAPGEITGTQLVERLLMKPSADGDVIELPFTDQNGQPYLQVRPASSRTEATLPFPDANGNLVVVPIPSGPRSRTADFPVVRPDTAGASTGDAGGGSRGAVNPADAPRPRGGGLQP